MFVSMFIEAFILIFGIIITGKIIARLIGSNSKSEHNE